MALGFNFNAGLTSNSLNQLTQPTTNINLGIDAAMNNIFANTALLSMPTIGAGDSAPYAMGLWPMAGGYSPTLLGGGFYMPFLGRGLFNNAGMLNNPGTGTNSLFSVGEGLAQLAATPFVAASRIIGSIFNFGCGKT